MHFNQVGHGGTVHVLTGCIGNGEHLPIVFIEGTLTAEKYLWYLMDVFFPFLGDPPAPPPPGETRAQAVVRREEDRKRRLRNHKFETGQYWWTQDGARPHIEGNVSFGGNL